MKPLKNINLEKDKNSDSKLNSKTDAKKFKKENEMKEEDPIDNDK